MINEDFKKWALGFSGCDGGDIGSPQHQSIWLCGLEWGGGFKPEQLADEFKNNVGKPPIRITLVSHQQDTRVTS